MTISISGGEGSRGGHVIGHTRSGKAVYGEGVRFKMRVGNNHVVGIVASRNAPRSTVPYKWQVRNGKRVLSEHVSSNEAHAYADLLAQQGK